MNIPLPRALALYALTTLCRLRERAVTAFANTTGDDDD